MTTVDPAGAWNLNHRDPLSVVTLSSTAATYAGVNVVVARLRLVAGAVSTSSKALGQLGLPWSIGGGEGVMTGGPLPSAGSVLVAAQSGAPVASRKTS